MAQRIIDFTSGAAFAISGNLQKISNYIFLVTPTDVDISGDLQDLLNTSFDASSMRSKILRIFNSEAMNKRRTYVKKTSD